jgi:Flp pilus assembly protein TadG
MSRSLSTVLQSIGARLRDGCARLRRDQRGSAMWLMVAGLIPSIGLIGSGIDAGRIYMVKTQLQAGVDAAALAGARAFSISGTEPNSRESQAAAYFNGNFPTGFMGSATVALDPQFQVVNGVNVTTVTATTTIPMSFMKVFGFLSQPVTAVAKAQLQPRPLEVMVVLDNTGSMKTNLPADKYGVVKTRMTALKDAAKSFVDILYQGGSTRSDLGMGFVMYDITANVGKLLTAWKPSSVRQLYGFNDSYTSVYGGGSWPANHLAWKGCVLADDTVKDVNATASYHENGAWDIDRTLPGEGLHPPVTPYFVPPMWVPKTAAGTTATSQMPTPSSAYYTIATNVEPNFNLYKLDATYYDNMLNYDAYNNNHASNPYRRWFYQYYIGLNNGSTNASDDVITRTDGSYYDPTSNPWNFTTGTGTPFKINYARAPQFAQWAAAQEYSVNPAGGSTNSGSANQTLRPSPNWQCPEEAVPVAYGRAKSAYYDVINNDNGAIYPANGTLHHAGLLWGYRLLVRDDVFTRTNPTNEQPKRALVFMTDGETALGTTQNGYGDRTSTFYGNYDDAPISASKTNLLTQSMRRFAKTCASLQAEANPPSVYIIALSSDVDSTTLSMFEQCAPGHVYRTADTASLKEAFDAVATELVDLHLVK